MSTDTLPKPGVRVDGTECLDPNEVQIGTSNGPGIYIAPPGTAPPAGTQAPWSAPWSCLGYLSDDGPTVGQSTDSADITPWQSVVPIRSVITSRGVTLQFVMWQLRAETLAIYFDVDPPETGDDGEVDFDIRTDSPQHLYAVGIDSADADRVFRVAFYRASLAAVGDMQIQRGAPIPLDVTLSALDDGGKLARVMLGPRAGVQGAQYAADLSRADVAARAGAGTVTEQPSPQRQRGAVGGK